ATDTYLQSDTAAIALIVERRSIQPPVANTPQTYTGYELVGVPGGEGYQVWSGSGTNPGTYLAMVQLDENHRWADGSTNTLYINWEIVDLPAPAPTPVPKKGTLRLEVECIPASDPHSIAFAQLRPEGTAPAEMYEAWLVNTQTGQRFELAQRQVYLIELINPLTGDKHRVLWRDNADGTFDCVLVAPDAVIRYPVADFSLYGEEADEVYIEGIAPHVGVDLDGWAYWVFETEDGEMLILRIAAEWEG
ncbi:MAG: hypothetical protein LBM74_01745, partial [Oscillospiraceae bacterium]|nr:hypothetical protein [Oscillospiraceae bacterium]